MTGNSLSRLTGKAVFIRGNDIDTDRIIPARFLKCVTFDELGPSLFYDERFDSDGNSKQHQLDDARHQGASILVSDENFGCGSSREHAPQAIQKSGFRAVIAGSFAEIFHGNCTTLGIPCIIMQTGDRQRLAQLVDSNPDTEVGIDIDAMTLTCGHETFKLSMKDSARQAFLAGTFDPLDRLLATTADIRATAERLGYDGQE